MPKVSVIIPTYNRIEFVYRAIYSVLNQSLYDLEVIVVDDCSTDPRYSDLDTFNENPRVKIIHLKENMRVLHNSKHAQGMTRNEGLKVATGEYIAFLDDDDFYCDPKKLEYQIELMTKFPECQMCCSNAWKGHGLEINSYNQMYFYNYFGEQIVPGIFKIGKELLNNTNYVMNSSVLVHKDVLEKTGPLRLEVAEDWECWKRCLNHTQIIYTSKPLIGYDMSHGFGKQYVY